MQRHTCQLLLQMRLAFRARAKIAWPPLEDAPKFFGCWAPFKYSRSLLAVTCKAHRQDNDFAIPFIARRGHILIPRLYAAVIPFRCQAASSSRLGARELLRVLDHGPMGNGHCP